MSQLQLLVAYSVHIWRLCAVKSFKVYVLHVNTLHNVYNELGVYGPQPQWKNVVLTDVSRFGLITDDVGTPFKRNKVRSSYVFNRKVCVSVSWNGHIKDEPSTPDAHYYQAWLKKYFQNIIVVMKAVTHSVLGLILSEPPLVWNTKLYYKYAFFQQQ